MEISMDSDSDGIIATEEIKLDSDCISDGNETNENHLSNSKPEMSELHLNLVAPVQSESAGMECGGKVDVVKHNEALTSDQVEDSAVELQTTFDFWDHQLNDTDKPLKRIAKVSKEFPNACLKGCKWSPDGGCLLTNAEDKVLRVYNLPQTLMELTDWSSMKSQEDDTWESVVRIKEGGQVYDYQWFPGMSSFDQATSCLLSTAQDNPIHLWDAFTGDLRATYLAYNYADVIMAAHSIAFDPWGQWIYAGYTNGIRIFDLNRPGRECKNRFPKKFEAKLHGIISCISVSPNGTGVYACGSFSKGLGIYLEDGTLLTVLNGHNGGLTHLKFSRDGMTLYSGARKDNRLICWDMRNLSVELQVFERVVTTSQRIYFDLSPNEKYLVSGGTDGELRLWDLSLTSTSTDMEQPHARFQGSQDCVNGMSLNPCAPLLATTTGQRYFASLADNDTDELFVESEIKKYQENSVSILAFE